MVNGDFPICQRSGWLKIGFSTSDLPIDPLFSGFGGGDLSPTLGQPVLKLDQMGQAGELVHGFVWTPLSQLQKHFMWFQVIDVSFYVWKYEMTTLKRLAN